MRGIGGGCAPTLVTGAAPTCVLPPEITEFIPEGHPAHSVRDLVVEELDFAAILDTYAEDKGLAKVEAEWQLACLAHNLRKLARASA